MLHIQAPDPKRRESENLMKTQIPTFCPGQKNSNPPCFDLNISLLTSRMRGFLIFILIFLSAATTAQGSGCAPFLESDLKSKSRLLRLNPSLESSHHSHHLDVMQKEIWRLLPNGQLPWKDRPELSEDLKTHLRSEFHSTFRTEDMSDNDLYLFYLNQMRSTHLLALREWVEFHLQDLGFDDGELKGIGLSLFSRIFETSILFSQTLDPKRASEIINSQSWREFPWEEAKKILSEPIENLKLSGRHKSQLLEALAKPGIPNPCCLTSGCLLCPNNRAWHRTRK